MKSLIGFKKSMNPNKSVAKPGVIRKIPDITINKPSLNAFIKFCGSVIPDNFKWKYHTEKNKLIIETNKPDEDMSKIINFMNQNNIAIDKIKAKESSLEEIFINLTNDEKK